MLITKMNKTKGEPIDTDVCQKPRLGFMAGEITVPDDFDQMASVEVENLFNGDAT